MKQEIITFRKLSDYDICNFIQNEPSAFNGFVNVIKYKITIEEIKEPIEVIQERLENLWVECDNWHNWDVLEATAKKFNYKFKGQQGSKRRKIK